MTGFATWAKSPTFPVTLSRGSEVQKSQGMGRRPSTFIFVRILCPTPSLKRMDQGAEPGPVQMSYMAESYLCFLGRCWGALNAGHCHPLHFCITGPFICSPRLQSGVLLWYHFLGYT